MMSFNKTFLPTENTKASCCKRQTVKTQSECHSTARQQLQLDFSANLPGFTRHDPKCHLVITSTTKNIQQPELVFSTKKTRQKWLGYGQDLPEKECYKQQLIFTSAKEVIALVRFVALSFCRQNYRKSTGRFFMNSESKK